MSKSPAFQFYPHDFLAGRVATYTLEERGAFITLLSFDWTLNGLPTDEKTLAKLCGLSSRQFAKVWAVLAEQFPVQGEGDEARRCNPRLALEREKQRAYSEKMAENGRKGGRPKESDGKAAALPIESTPSPTPSPKENNYSAEFAECRAVYPKRKGDQGWVDAEKAYSRWRKAGESHADILAGTLAYARECEAEGKVGGPYVMQAKTFFGPGKRWAESREVSPPVQRDEAPRTLRATEMLLELPRAA